MHSTSGVTKGRDIIFTTQNAPEWKAAIEDYRNAVTTALDHINNLQAKTGTIGFSFTSHDFQNIGPDHVNPFDGKNASEWDEIKKKTIQNHAPLLFDHLVGSLKTANVIDQTAADVLKTHLHSKHGVEFLSIKLTKLFEKIEKKRVLPSNLKTKHVKIKEDFKQQIGEIQSKAKPIIHALKTNIQGDKEFKRTDLASELSKAIPLLPHGNKLLSCIQTFAQGQLDQPINELHTLCLEDIPATTALIKSLGTDPTVASSPSLKAFFGVWGKFLASMSPIEELFVQVETARQQALIVLDQDAGHSPRSMKIPSRIPLELCNGFLEAADKFPLPNLPAAPLLEGPYPHINDDMLQRDVEKPNLTIKRPRPALATLIPVLPETAPIGREHIFNTHNHVEWQEAADQLKNACLETDYNLWLMWSGAKLGYSSTDKKFGDRYVNSFVSYTDSSLAEDCKNKIRVEYLKEVIEQIVADLARKNIIQNAHQDGVKEYFIKKINSQGTSKLGKAADRIFEQGFKSNTEKQAFKNLKTETTRLDAQDFADAWRAYMPALKTIIDDISQKCVGAQISLQAQTLSKHFPADPFFNNVVQAVQQTSTSHLFQSKLEYAKISPFIEYLIKNQNSIVQLLDAVAKTAEVEKLEDLRKFFGSVGYALKSISNHFANIRDIQTKIRANIREITKKQGHVPNVSKESKKLMDLVDPKLWEAFFKAASGPTNTPPAEVAAWVNPTPPAPPQPPVPKTPTGSPPPPKPIAPTGNNQPPVVPSSPSTKSTAPSSTQNSKPVSKPAKENRFVTLIKKPFIWLKSLFSSLFGWLFKKK